MTELAVPEPNHSPAAVAQNRPSPFVVQSSIADWAREADLAFQLAERLSMTSFVPSTMRGKVGDITACLLAGNELGLRPMAALKSMDVIQGTPALRAHAMRGLVQSHGHEIELVESTDTLCVMRGRRKGAEEWQTVHWPIARAALMGLTTKDQWKKQPKTMLVARATSEICRLIASDVLHAVAYSTEELRDQAVKVTAVQVKAPVSAAEILGAPPAEVPQEATTAPVEPEPPALTAWQVAWQNVGTVAMAMGWTQQQTEDEFSKVNDGLEVNDASVEDLEAFIEHLASLAETESAA